MNYKPAYALGFDALETELTLYKRFNKPQTWWLYLTHHTAHKARIWKWTQREHEKRLVKRTDAAQRVGVLSSAEPWSLSLHLSYFPSTWSKRHKPSNCHQHTGKLQKVSFFFFWAWQRASAAAASEKCPLRFWFLLATCEEQPNPFTSSTWQSSHRYLKGVSISLPRKQAAAHRVNFLTLSPAVSPSSSAPPPSPPSFPRTAFSARLSRGAAHGSASPCRTARSLRKWPQRGGPNPHRDRTGGRGATGRGRGRARPRKPSHRHGEGAAPLPRDPHGPADPLSRLSAARLPRNGARLPDRAQRPPQLPSAVRHNVLPQPPGQDGRLPCRAGPAPRTIERKGRTGTGQGQSGACGREEAGRGRARWWRHHRVTPAGAAPDVSGVPALPVVRKPGSLSSILVRAARAARAAGRTRTPVSRPRI